MTILDVRTDQQQLALDNSTESKSATWGAEPRNLIWVETKEHFDAEMIDGVPAAMLRAFAEAAVRHAAVELVDGEWFASVAGFEGVWGAGDDVAAALEDLQASFLDWLELKLGAGARIPVIEGFDLNFPFRELSS